MNATQSQMKVYAVIGGYNYEGEDFNTLRLFDCESTSHEYEKQLVDVEGYDYALRNIKEVNMESAIAA